MEYSSTMRNEVGGGGGERGRNHKQSGYNILQKIACRDTYLEGRDGCGSKSILWWYDMIDMKKGSGDRQGTHYNVCRNLAPMYARPYRGTGRKCLFFNRRRQTRPPTAASLTSIPNLPPPPPPPDRERKGYPSPETAVLGALCL